MEYAYYGKTLQPAENKATNEIFKDMEKKLKIDLQSMDADQAIQAATKRMTETKDRYSKWADSLKPHNDSVKVVLESDVAIFKLNLTQAVGRAIRRLNENSEVYEKWRTVIVDATKARAELKSNLQPKYDKLAPTLPGTSVSMSLDLDKTKPIFSSLDGILDMVANANTLFDALNQNLTKLQNAEHLLHGDFKAEVSQAISQLTEQLQSLSEETNKLAIRYNDGLTKHKDTAARRITEAENELPKLLKKSSDLQTQRKLDQKGLRPGKKPITDVQLETAYHAYKEKEAEIKKLKKFNADINQYSPFTFSSGDSARKA